MTVLIIQKVNFNPTRDDFDQIKSRYNLMWYVYVSSRHVNVEMSSLLLMLGTDDHG